MVIKHLISLVEILLIGAFATVVVFSRLLIVVAMYMAMYGFLKSVTDL